MAQGTVTNRIRRLEERGVIQGYGVRVDPEQGGLVDDDHRRVEDRGGGDMLRV